MGNVCTVCCCLCPLVSRLEMCAQVFAPCLGTSVLPPFTEKNTFLHPKQWLNYIYPHSISFPTLLSDVFSVPSTHLWCFALPWSVWRSEPEAAAPTGVKVTPCPSPRTDFRGVWSIPSSCRTGFSSVPSHLAKNPAFLLSFFYLLFPGIPMIRHKLSLTEIWELGEGTGKNWNFLFLNLYLRDINHFWAFAASCF